MGSVVPVHSLRFTRFLLQTVCSSVLMAAVASSALALPEFFSDENIVAGLFLPTSLTFLPDGRLLVTHKTGDVTLVEDPTSPGTSLSTYLTIPDVNAGEDERGLMNLVLDPAFASNGHFYVYYSNEINQKFRVSRFTHSEASGGLTSHSDPTSEVMIWEDNEVYSSCCHYGGGLDFGPDGYLYLSTGEEFDGAQAQDLMRAGGKVHRFASDGSFPTDNPYFDGSPGLANASGQLQSIYSYGLRNPFRGAFDLPTGRFIMGEVGGNDNNISREDIHVAGLGVNMGWPTCEGSCFGPGDPGNPIHSYPHAGAGASVTGGIVYRGSMFPPEYFGAYFYGDWVRKWIRYLEFDYGDPALPVLADHAFANTGGQPLAFAEGPDGSLYYVETNRTGGVFQFDGNVRRIVFDSGNAPPSCTAAIALPMSSETAPALVQFSVSAMDADGDPLTYEWFFGDGDSSTLISPSHTYSALGQYHVEVFVSDPTTTTLCDPVDVTVGNPPTVEILAPDDESLFVGGEVVVFSGIATDIEDGPLAPSGLTWSATFLHNEHAHPAFSDVQGMSTTLTIPTSGHDFSSDTGFEIFLTAQDSNGLIGTDSIRIRPDKTFLNLFSTPFDGVELFLDAQPRTTPHDHDTVIHFEHTVEAPETQCVLSEELEFDTWSDAGSRIHDVTVSSQIDLTAQFQSPGECLNCGHALLLDGADDLIEIPALTLSGDFTIEAWVYIEPGTTVTNADGIATNGAGTQDINFHVGQARLYSTLTPGVADRVIANTVTQPGSWHHYAFAREAGILRVYVDGSLDATGAAAWTGDFTLSQLGRGVAGGLEGRLDEVRVWNLARSAGEIQAYRDLIVPRDTAGLAAYWRFDVDPLAQTTPDLSGNGLLATHGASTATGSDDPIVQSSDATVARTFCVSRSPLENRVLESDGIAAIDIPDIVLNGDFTIESWVYFPNGSPIGNADGIVTDGIGSQDINFYQGRVRLYSTPGGGHDRIIATTASTTGVWAHYALVREAGELTVYIDGVADVAAVGPWTGEYRVSEIASAVAGQLEGRLDELRIWNVARSAAEIDLYRHHRIPNDSLDLASLEAYYGFDEAGLVARDLSGNGRDAILVSGTRLISDSNLTYLPEASSRLLLGFGVGLLCLMRRARRTRG
jgi:glucose/arabinose dehydrogenase/PKD repeat protein